MRGERKGTSLQRQQTLSIQEERKEVLTLEKAIKKRVLGMDHIQGWGFSSLGVSLDIPGTIELRRKIKITHSAIKGVPTPEEAPLRSTGLVLRGK